MEEKTSVMDIKQKIALAHFESMVRINNWSESQAYNTRKALKAGDNNTVLALYYSATRKAYNEESVKRIIKRVEGIKS
jgi:hypothetical protein